VPSRSAGVTHVIASSLCATKTDSEMSKLRQKVKFVSATWILDSIAAHKRVKEDAYNILPKPPGQSTLSFAKAAVASSSSGSAAKVPTV
jgi:hypothetical protein